VSVSAIDTAAFPQVTLVVTARGPDGAPARIPALAGVSVVEDDEPASVASLVPETAPLMVALVVETSSAASATIQDVRAGIRALVSRLAESDKALLIVCSDRARVAHRLTYDVLGLAAELDSTDTGGDRGAPLSSSIALACAELSRTAGRRVAVLVVASAGGGGRPAAEDAAIEASSQFARDRGVALVTVAAGPGDGARALEKLARVTGGQVYGPASGESLRSEIAHVTDDLKQAHRLVFRSPRPLADGTSRTVSLTLTSARGDAAASGASVRFRYSAPDRTRAAPRPSPPVRPIAPPRAPATAPPPAPALPVEEPTVNMREDPVDEPPATRPDANPYQ
jgi:hypothetical protein